LLCLILEIGMLYLSHKENIDTSQSHLEWRDYSCHQKLLSIMTWHQSYDVVDGVMVHPSDGKSWKYFNNMRPRSSMESRNMRFGLCTDGFNPSRLFAAPYFCWLVILTVYNLQLKMCMRLDFMFVSTITIIWVKI
jgi:hypothetical protein